MCASVALVRPDRCVAARTEFPFVKLKELFGVDGMACLFHLKRNLKKRKTCGREADINELVHFVHFSMALARTEADFWAAYEVFKSRWKKSVSYFQKTWIDGAVYQRWAQPWLRTCMTLGRISSSEAESMNQ